MSAKSSTAHDPNGEQDNLSGPPEEAKRSAGFPVAAGKPDFVRHGSGWHGLLDDDSPLQTAAFHFHVMCSSECNTFRKLHAQLKVEGPSDESNRTPKPGASKFRGLN